MTRMEIEPFCSGKDRFSKDRELSVLSEENLIQMVSYPTFRQGVFIPTENDQYALADKGYDLLATVAKNNFRFRAPIVVSVISLAVAAGSLVVAILSFLR